MRAALVHVCTGVSSSLRRCLEGLESNGRVGRGYRSGLAEKVKLPSSGALVSLSQSVDLVAPFLRCAAGEVAESSAASFACRVVAVVFAGTQSPRETRTQTEAGSFLGRPSGLASWPQAYNRPDEDNARHGGLLSSKS